MRQLWLRLWRIDAQPTELLTSMLGHFPRRSDCGLRLLLGFYDSLLKCRECREIHPQEGNDHAVADRDTLYPHKANCLQSDVGNAV